jgi:hypothetical protein
MRIKNVNDMSEKACRCGNWLAHWKNLSRQPIPAVCSARSCDQIPSAGAFCQKDNYFEDTWYIVPLCGKHNRLFGATLDLKEGTVLVKGGGCKDCVTPLVNVPQLAGSEPRVEKAVPLL